MPLSDHQGGRPVRTDRQEGNPVPVRPFLRVAALFPPDDHAAAAGKRGVADRQMVRRGHRDGFKARDAGKRAFPDGGHGLRQLHVLNGGPGKGFFFDHLQGSGQGKPLCPFSAGRYQPAGKRRKNQQQDRIPDVFSDIDHLLMTGALYSNCARYS